MKKLSLLVLSLLLAVAYSFAQAPQAHPKNLNWIPGEPQTGGRAASVFLKGDYIELGIDVYGSCGTLVPPPAGYHNYATYSGLGFVADHNLDGWANGSPKPYSGDYFLPGYPWEAWLCEYTYLGSEYTFVNCGADYIEDVPQTSLTNTSAGSENSAVWIGTATGGGQFLEVEQTFHFMNSDGKFYIDVTLTNTGRSPLQDVEYARAVDPDQEVDLGGDFVTINYVSSQPSGPNTLAEVIGYGPDFGVPMALQLDHPNAKAHVVPDELAIYSPNEPLDQTFAPTQAAPYVNDVGVAVAVRFPLLNPGESETFTVVYLLNQEDVPPPVDVPISNWALALMIGLIVIFTIIRFKRMN